MDLQPDLETLEHLDALSLHLRDRRQSILDLWRAAVLADPKLETAANTSLVHFENIVPRVLDGLERALRLASDRVLSQSEREKFSAHGSHRWQQGYSLREVVREWGHLQLCVLSEIERFSETYAGARPKAVAFARQLWLELCNEGIGDSVEQFAELQQTEAEGLFLDLQRAVTELQDLDRQRAEVWHEAAHDLRGNVSLVTSSAAILTEEEVPDRLRAKAFSLLQTSVISLLELLEDLLSLARLEAGREALQLQTFDAGALLQSLCSTLEARSRQKGLSLRTEGPASLMVEGDTAKIQRILQNLALNAIKYTERGEIIIGWGPTQETDIDRWRLSIQDTGPGMSSAQGGPLAEGLREATEVAKLTEDLSDSTSLEPVPTLPAASQPQTASFQKPGEGIGLLIVKRLCELLQASLEIVSEPGQGTIIQVVLPRSYGKPSTPAPH
jgi:signal transduction histidine kinase